MTIDILTLFPNMFSGPFDESIIKRAKEKGLVEINLHNFREFAEDKHGTVDDKPYGGGVGMVLRVDVIAKALEALKNLKSQYPISNKIKNSKSKKQRVILLTPQGRVFDQEKARELSKLEHIVLICGHYEGFDERIREHLVDEELSIGEYVLTGGEIPVMVVCDAITRLIPGVLLKQEATKCESFSDFREISKTKQINPVGKKVIEYPQYTRPEEYNGWKVPEVLLSGNHKKIDEWKVEKMLEKIKKRK